MQDLTQFKEELRRRLPLSRLVGSRVRLKKHGGNAYKGLCPFHKEKTPSFHVFDDNGQYHCFGCGVHGDAIEFLERTENLTFLEALGKMAQIIGIPMPDFKRREEAPLARLDVWYNIYEEATRFFQACLMGPEGQKARTYLEKRLISPSVWQTFRLGYAPKGRKLIDYLSTKGFGTDMMLTSKLVYPSARVAQDIYAFFQDRLIFPITDRLGKVIAFGGRLLGEGQPKYVNSSDTLLFHKGRELYNHAGARKSHKSLPVVVAEGYMDVLALHQMGECRPVATLGTACTAQHLECLWHLSPQPVFCFDGDQAGKEAARKAVTTLLPLLKVGYTASFLELPPHLDPADLWERGQKESFHGLLSRPVSLFEFIWHQQISSRGAATPEAQAKMEADLLQMIDQIQDKSLRARAYSWGKQQLSDYFWSLRRSKKKGTPLGFKKELELPSPLSQTMIQEKAAKIFMVLLINYPRLAVDFEEEAGKFNIPFPLLNELKDKIIAFCHANKTIDNSILNHHLKEQGYGDILLQIIKEATVHTPLAKPGHPYEVAKKVWLQLLEQQIWQEESTKDMERWQKELSENFTAEKWEKFRLYQQQRLLYERQLFQDEALEI